MIINYFLIPYSDNCTNWVGYTAVFSILHVCKRCWWVQVVFIDCKTLFYFSPRYTLSCARVHCPQQFFCHNIAGNQRVISSNKIQSAKIHSGRFVSILDGLKAHGHQIFRLGAIFKRQQNDKPKKWKLFKNFSEGQDNIICLCALKSERKNRPEVQTTPAQAEWMTRHSVLVSSSVLPQAVQNFIATINFKPCKD